MPIGRRPRGGVSPDFKGDAQQLGGVGKIGRFEAAPE
jgi:hypothetical protein